MINSLILPEPQDVPFLNSDPGRPAETYLQELNKAPPRLAPIVAVIVSSPVPMGLFWEDGCLGLNPAAHSLFGLQTSSSRMSSSDIEMAALNIAYYARCVLRTGQAVSVVGGHFLKACPDLHLSPVLGSDGAADGVLVVFTAERSTSLLQRQRNIQAEYRHRVLNLLALFRSIVSGSSEFDPSETFAMHLTDRVASVARVQAMLIRNESPTVHLEDLLIEELSAQGGTETNTTLSGPAVCVGSKIAETLGLAIHELATNAMKFGAIAAEFGHIDVTWEFDEEREPQQLKLTWRERGVSVVSSAPRHRGFGMNFIEHAVPYELRGEAHCELHPGGMHCELTIPADDTPMLSVCRILPQAIENDL